jgi:hypothetical protein
MDFLTQLAARALNELFTVEPRPVSLFERDRWDAVGDVEIEATQSPRQVHGEVPMAPAARVEHSPDVERESSPAAKPRAEPAETEALPRPMAVETPPEPTPVVMPSAARAPEPSPIPQPVVAAQTRGFSQPAPTILRRTEQVTYVEHHTRPETVHREIVSRATAPMPEAAPRTRRLAVPPVLPASEPSVSIEVSIGRVEVRQVSPAAAPARKEAARKTPGLSLEDYLKHRNRAES